MQIVSVSKRIKQVRWGGAPLLPSPGSSTLTRRGMRLTTHEEWGGGWFVTPWVLRSMRGLRRFLMWNIKLLKACAIKAGLLSCRSLPSFPSNVLVVESDVLSIVKVLNMGAEDLSEVSNIVGEIGQFASQFGLVSYSFCKLSSNVVAHCLVRAASGCLSSVGPVVVPLPNIGYIFWSSIM